MPFALCAVCKAPIGMGGRYYRCSVSSCNTGSFKLAFCKLACWDAHVPGARHRDAAALEEIARPEPPKRRRRA